MFHVVFFSLSLLQTSASAQPVSIRPEYGKGELLQLCTDAIAENDARLKAIAKIPAKERRLQNTILAFEEANAEFYEKYLPLNFMKNVSPDENTRKEAEECSQKVSEFGNDVSTRRDLYLAMKDQKGRNALERRLVKQTLLGFEHSGMKLSDEDLQKYRELLNKLSTLQLEFGNAIRRDNSSVEFTEDELRGTSPDWLASKKRSPEGKVIAPTREPDFLEVEQSAENSETRKRMMFAMYNRAADENIPRLEEALLLRQQIAALLGYKNWGDYKNEDNMAKSSDKIMHFLDGLLKPLQAGNRRAIAELLAFKKELDPTATSVDQWDLFYLPFQYQSRKLQVNLEQVREYFPADVVIPAMLSIYSEMLGVTYHLIPDAKVWAPGVEEYEIRDKKTHKTLGYFYLDLYSRPGKYAHAANATLLPGRSKNGHYNYPLAGVMANLSPGTNGKPPLLSFTERGEVVTLFHEFGHTMHATLTRAPYASMSGTSVKHDFVEAPSQMLENWVWQPEIVNRLSGHYQDHSKKLPPELLAKLVQIKNFQPARLYVRQVLLASYDMGINLAKGPVDTVKAYKEAYERITEGPMMDGARFPASFGHLMSGYDAGYYGYLWSKVYAEDMFTVFKKAGLVNPAAGARYRKYILEPGDTKDPDELLRKFLGREPNPEAFLKSIGAK